MSDSKPPDYIRIIRDETIEVITYLRERAAKLDLHNHNIKITRVTGGAAGLIGGGLATGLILAPFTAGISALVVGIVGASVAGAGGFTSLGGFVTGKVIDHFTLKKAEATWADLQKKLQPYLPDPKAESENCPVPGEGLDDKIKGWYHVLMAGNLATNLISKSDDLISLAANGGRIAATAGRPVIALAAPFAILNVLSMGFSLYDIVQGSRALHKKTKSPAGDYLRKLADDLDKLVQILDKE